MINQPCLPYTMDAEFLATLLFKEVSSILRDVSRDKKHERQPPHIKAGKKPIWLTQVVFAWMEGKSSEPVIIKIELDLKPNSTAARSTPPATQSLTEILMSVSASAGRV